MSTDVSGMIECRPGARLRGLDHEGAVWEVDIDLFPLNRGNAYDGIVALVFRCKPSGGEERTSTESTVVEWLTPEENTARMTEVYGVRLLDALDDKGSHVRSHDGRHLLEKTA
ncbi:hypothetical protein [Streptomyces sp. NPDC001744]|uniref:hypothetical protein n=1 Tax=Streptomyces sp. NPDC001744 TaxID=3364606 RepID=UPI00369C6850